MGRPSYVDFTWISSYPAMAAVVSIPVLNEYEENRERFRQMAETRHLIF